MTWSETVVYTHHLPPTGDDERGHVLDPSCWCEPDVLTTDVLHHVTASCQDEQVSERMVWAPVATDRLDDAEYLNAVAAAAGMDTSREIMVRETMELGPDYPENLTVLIGYARP